MVNHLIAILVVFASFIPANGLALDWDTTSLPRGYSYRMTLNASGHVYAIADSMLYMSTNEGATWSTLGRFALNGRPHSIRIAPSGTIYGADFAIGVYRSTDNGSHWSANLVNEGCNGFAVHPEGYLFAGLTYTGNGKVHRSTDGGDTWTGIPLPNSSGSFATGCFAFGDHNEVYAGAIDGFYRSTDFGVSWTQFNVGLLGRHVRTMVVLPNQDIFIQTIYSSTFDGVYRSTNRGESWLRIGSNNPYFSALTASPNVNIYGTSDDGVFQSTDQGTTWANISPSITTQLVSIVMTPGGRILVGGAYVFRSRTTTTSADETPSLPAKFSLMQNYPNPFNPTTSIRFRIPNLGFVSLTVFDVLGRELKALVNEVKAPGEYSVSFDASDLGSGVYFYRLRTGDFVETRKLVLMK